MAFVSLSSSDIEVGDFVTADLMTQIKDDLDALNAKTVYSAGLANGSFEVDSDANGVPDSWTVSLYPGGSMAISTSAGVQHGEQCIAFTHPGGAGNGGGRIYSDYIACDEHAVQVVKFDLQTNNRDLKCAAIMNYYDIDKVATTSITLYESTDNSTRAKRHTRYALPPSGSRFSKLQLIGGQDDKDTTGIAYFDGVDVYDDYRLNPGPGDDYKLAYSHNGYSTNRSSSLERVIEFEVPVCGILRTDVFLGQASLSGSGNSVYGQIYRNGVPVGSGIWASTGWVEFTEDTTGWAIGDTLQLYIRGESTFNCHYSSFMIITNTPGAPSFINISPIPVESTGWLTS